MTSFCLYYERSICRSCSWIEHDYEEQIRLKERSLKAALRFFPELPLEPSVRSPEQGFRNRAKMIITGTLDAPIVGLTGDADLDQGRELLNCPIHHPRLNEVIVDLPRWIQEYQLTPYRIRERKGELKAIIAFYSPKSGQMYLRWVLRSRECVARIKKALPRLQERFPSLVCVSANIQPVPHAILEGPEELVLTRQEHIDHEIGGIRMRLSPRAFVQTNVGVASRLYETAAQWVKASGSQRMLELYCGQGAFSFFSAGSADQLLGIEINEQAVRSASETARSLGLDNVRFKAADATQVSDEIRKFRPELILANPPRRGLADGVRLIRDHLPEHFVYSSCAAETLATDLQALSDRYGVQRAQLFDMFPHTEHFETLVWLRRHS